MKKTLLILTLLVSIFILPFYIDHGGEFGGADGEAQDQIMQLSPDDEPWFESFYEPASGEIESLLFTLQGSLETAVIFYILGYYRGGRKDAEH